MKSRFGLAGGVLVWVSACTYAPEEEYFKAIEEPDPVAYISLNTFDQSDTIFIYKPTDFSFDVGIDRGSIREVQVLLNDKEISSTSGAGGLFSLDENNHLKTGVYTLQIRFISSTASGSLADKLDAEYVEVWRKWILRIDVDPPPRPVVVLSKENGLLKVSWAPYTKPDFVEYRVWVYGLGSHPEPIVITDPEKTFLLNENYAGGYRISYAVELRTQMHWARSFDAQRIDDFNLTGEYRFSDSTVMLRWSKADFEGAFKNYTILENDVVTHEILNASDTSLRFRPVDVVFGLPVMFSLRLYSVDGRPIHSTYPYTQPRLVETPSLQPMPDRFSYNATLDAVIGLDGNMFSIYDAMMQPQESFFTGNTFVPAAGADVYYPDEGEKGIVQLNLQTRALAYINILKTTTGGIYTSARVRSASGNQIVSYGYRAHNGSGDYLVYHVRVYDMVNGITLYKEEGSDVSFFHAPVISADGKYLESWEFNTYRINGTNLELLWELPPYHSFVMFRPDNSEEILALYSNEIHIFDTQTGTLKRSYAPPAGNYVFRGYDPLTKNLFFAGDGAKVCYAINIDTHEQTAISAYNADASNLQMINGYVFDNNGNYFKAIGD